MSPSATRYIDLYRAWKLSNLLGHPEPHLCDELDVIWAGLTDQEIDWVELHRDDPPEAPPSLNLKDSPTKIGTSLKPRVKSSTG